MKKGVYKNAIIGFLGQFIILLLGLIIPRLIIINYGSDTNGVLSTITQIFTYMALLEAGIGQAAKNLLYKPFENKDKKEISKIYCASQKYYKQVTYIYFAGVVLSSLIVPFIIKSDLDIATIGLMCFFQGAGGAISFYYIQTQSIVLNVDGKNYINNLITLANQIISYIVKIIMAIFGINVIVIQLTYFLITIFKVIIYQIYFKRKYNWIDTKINIKNFKLKDRNSFILTEIAWTIFSSTDMIILSIFIGSKSSSVYSVYNMVFVSLNSLLSSIFMSISYVLGRTYHENIDKYKKMHDCFNSFFMSAIVIMMICSYALTLPFVKLYTNGVNDVEYIYSSIPILFCLIQIISWSRFVSGNLTGIAGYAKQTSYVSLFEAIANILLSIVFVNIWGIFGVLLATVISLTIKVIFCNYISDKVIMKRPIKNTIKILGINYIIFILSVFIIEAINIKIDSYLELAISGLTIFLISGSITIMINYLINKDLKNIIRYNSR